MPIDTSAFDLGFQNFKQPEMPDYLGSMGRAMSLKDLALGAQAKQQQFNDQAAMRQAYAQNLGQDGRVNPSGLYSSLVQSGAGHLIPQAQEQITRLNKDSAEAQSKQAEAYNAAKGILANQYAIVKSLPPEKQEAEFERLKAEGIKQGVDPRFYPDHYDPGHFVHDDYLAASSTPSLNNKKTAAETEKALAEAAKTRSETIKQNPQGVQADDPATLVPHFIPKEHQAKALEEIKNAQNIKSLAPKIDAAFKRASSRNPNEAANGRKEFEALINTTVTDLTGTARQAEFDSIHNNLTPSGLLARPGENEAKHQALINYLAAKSAAPTAKAYGIDLAKYNSTSPYSYQGSGGGNGKIGDALFGGDAQKAIASDKRAPDSITKGQVYKGHVFNGGDPTDPKNWKKAVK